MFSDSRIWQLNGTNWEFIEQTPHRTIPEFPYFISFTIMISVVITLIFTKIKNKVRYYHKLKNSHTGYVRYYNFNEY